MDQSRAQQYSKEQWEKIKSLVQDLYFRRRLPYKEVIETLRDDHGILLTRRQFYGKVKSWDFAKNVKDHEMRQVVERLNQAAGRRLADPVAIRGQQVAPAKIQRWQKRRGQFQVHHRPAHLIASRVIALTETDSENLAVLTEHDIPMTGYSTQIIISPEVDREVASDETCAALEIESDMPDLKLLLIALNVNSVEELSTAPDIPLEFTATDIYVSNLELQDIYSGNAVAVADYDPFAFEVYPFPAQPTTTRSTCSTFDTWNSLDDFQVETLINLHQKALPRLAQSLGTRHPDFLNAKLRLGALYRECGKLDTAEQLFREVATGMSAINKPMDRTAWIAHLWYIDAVACQNQHLRAERLLTKFVGMLPRHLDQSDPIVLDILELSADLAFIFDRFEEALTLFRQILQIRLLTLGPRNKACQVTLRAVADTLHYLKESKYACESERLYFICLKLNADDRKFASQSLRLLGEVLNWQGRKTEGHAVLVEASEVSQHSLGHEHPIALTALSSLASSFQLRGDNTECAKICRQILRVCAAESCLGSHYESNTMLLLADTLIDEGEYEEATDLLGSVLSSRAFRLGIGHGSTIYAARRISECYERQGLFSKAKAVFIDVMERVANEHGPEHRATLWLRKYIERLSYQ